MRLVLLFIMVNTTFCFSKPLNDKDSIVNNEIKRYGIAFLPSKAHHIYGLSFGLIGSEVYCNLAYTKHSHGINIQVVGQGVFSLFYLFNSSFLNHNQIPDEKDPVNTDMENEISKDSLDFKRVVHNGVLFSLFGTFSDEVNGVSIGSLMSINDKINGLSLHLIANNIQKLNGVSLAIFNSSFQTKGMQIGLVNKTHKLQGLQLGFWNVNESRKLPIINW